MTNKELAELIQATYEEFNLIEYKWNFMTQSTANDFRVCPIGAAFIGTVGNVRRAEEEWNNRKECDEYKFVAEKLGTDYKTIGTISKIHVRKIYTAAEIVERLKSGQFEADITNMYPQS